LLPPPPLLTAAAASYSHPPLPRLTDFRWEHFNFDTMNERAAKKE
jgi:hypothetical protein